MIDYTYFSLQNPWWQDKSAIANDDNIKELSRLSYRYEPKEVLDLCLRPGDIHLITGPRQTGKSTAVKLYIQHLLKSGFENQAILFFNCDALSTIRELIEVVNEFKKLQDSPAMAIFLDEVSSVPLWPQAIKWLVDNGLLKRATVFLTGSSSLQLKKSGEFLPGRRGRGRDVVLLPINFSQFLKLKGLATEKKDLRTLVRADKYFNEYLLYGGFLRNLNYSPIENAPIYQATLRSELFKAGKKEDSLREVIRKILGSLTNQTSYSNIAEEAELGSKNTAVDYLNFLSDSYFLKEVKFYEISQQRPVLKKNKKYYTTDPYFVWLFKSFVSGVGEVALMSRGLDSTTEKAKLVENFVASELFKGAADFYFFQNSRELDFFLPKEKLAIEVKYKEKITGEDEKSLRLSVVPGNVKKILVTRDTWEKRGDLSLIPAHLLTLADFWPTRPSA